MTGIAMGVGAMEPDPGWTRRVCGRWLPAALAAALAGCGSWPAADRLPPRADVRVPAAWQAAPPLVTTAGQVTQASLDQMLDDPAFARLAAAAHGASPTLAVASARVERARAARLAADASLQPLAQAVGAVQVGRATAEGSTARSASLGVQAGWELDLFGGRRADVAAAAASWEAEIADRQALQRSLTAEVATNLVALRACVAQRELVAEDSRSRAETERLTSLRERVGFSAPSEAALARASSAQGRSATRVQAAACELQLKGLVELTGLPEADLRDELLRADRGVPAARGFAVGRVPAQLLSHRPDVAAAAARLSAAAAVHDSAQAAMRPRVTWSGSVGLAAARQGGIAIDGSTWAVGPLQIEVPLFDSGARRASAEAARAEYDAALAQLQAQVRRAVREVEQALVTLQAATARQPDLQAAATDFEAVLRATQARQQGGLASLFELEEARRNAVAARGALVELRREQTQAWIDLSRALGTDPAR